MCAQTVSIYPQARPFVDGEQASFLDQPLIAKLCTHNADGTIHIAPVWFRADGEDILLGTQEMSRKVRNINQDPNVSMRIDTVELPFKGVIIYGTAEIEYEEVIPRRVAIFEKYMDAAGAQDIADGLARTWTPVIVRIRPKRTITYDYEEGFGIATDGDAEIEDIF